VEHLCNSVMGSGQPCVLVSLSHAIVTEGRVSPAHILPQRPSVQSAVARPPRLLHLLTSSPDCLVQLLRSWGQMRGVLDLPLKAVRGLCLNAGWGRWLLRRQELTQDKPQAGAIHPCPSQGDCPWGCSAILVSPGVVVKSEQKVGR
jgi:hypothetical protein